MSIDLSLVITSSSRPTARSKQDARLLAWRRAFVPVAWSAMFDGGDVVPLEEEDGAPTLFCRAAEALARLRERSPVLARRLPARASAALDALAAGLAAATASEYVQLRLHELVPAWSGAAALREMVESTRAPELTGWTAALHWAGMDVEKRRIVMTRHGGTLAQACVGEVCGHEMPAAPARSIALRDALAATEERGRMHGAVVAAAELEEVTAFLLLEDELVIDGPWLDALEATFRGSLQLPPTLAEVARGMTQAADPSHRPLAQQVIDRLLDEVAEPFAPVATLPAEQAAAALAALTVEAARRGKLGRALRSRSEPLALSITAAGPVRAQVPAAQLALLRWFENGNPLPRRERLPAAILACRFHALRHGLGSLSHHDPLAPPVELFGARATPWSWALGLGWTGETLRVWSNAPELPSVEQRRLAANTFVRRCVAMAGEWTESERAWLLSRGAVPVDDALLDADDRAILRAALGDAGAVPAVLAAATADPARVDAAIAVLTRQEEVGEELLAFFAATAPRWPLAATALAKRCGGDPVRLALVLDALQGLPARVTQQIEYRDEGMTSREEQESFAAEVHAAVEGLAIVGAVPSLQHGAEALLTAVRAAIADASWLSPG
ncbi:hypothetical protein [Polyangium sorediatum]|uniref:Uncharacterized protein n=1 Tax=Polyangium sorediatum TaxID=889274 RepID=A0ABT6P7V7_9BACT|nr:hypothetical protein [Polyangium sorediatum]MDI1436709.1 hypothetical protein [Polyangium sorediatum]